MITHDSFGPRIDGMPLKIWLDFVIQVDMSTNGESYPVIHHKGGLQQIHNFTSCMLQTITFLWRELEVKVHSECESARGG